MLRAFTALTTPLLPEDYLGLVDPLWSQTVLRGRVVAVRRETARATTLTIKPGRRWKGHRAGQFVRLGVDVDGVRHWRTYSLNGNENSRLLSVTVQALPGGVVSPQLAHGTPVGTVLHLEDAAGEFVLPTPTPAKLLMLTAGSGITPVMGMLRTLAARGPLTDVVLVHSAPTSDDVIFRDELTLLAALHPGLRLVVRHTADSGRLDLAELDDLAADREVFVCGPDALLTAAQQRWGAKVRLERFTPPVRSEGGSGGTVAYGATTVDVDGGASLLEAGEEAGVLMPSGCRMGICFGCVLPLRDGQVRNLRTGEIHGEPGDLVQTCISGASGPATFDI
ncbi:MAG: ferredoxin reductase [Pseudonocardia sp.]|jgi:ferredoxin-NADP reductase|uniref:ferredoxin reductase n=1 Tax=Pseudonocardia sp. TaxID=60912 RepID=UPI001ACD253B|nr:ferredoxin reductase [Pseudonocardia sp.]MBN9100504.1 ferredoxin reductase [Pseudonocardia sp.]